MDWLMNVGRVSEVVLADEWRKKQKREACGEAANGRA
jgi:hypothetical protein